MDNSEIRRNEEISDVIIVSDDENVKTNLTLSARKKIKIDTGSYVEENNDAMEFIDLMDSDEDIELESKALLVKSFLQSEKEKRTAKIISEIVYKFNLARSKATNFSDKVVASQLTTPQKELNILIENNLINFNSIDTQNLQVYHPARSSASSIKSPFMLHRKAEKTFFSNVLHVKESSPVTLDTEQEQTFFSNFSPTKLNISANNSLISQHNLNKSVLLKIEENKAKSSVNSATKISANFPLEVNPCKLPESINCEHEDKKPISLIYPPVIPEKQLISSRKFKMEENREKCGAKYPPKISLIAPQKTQIKLVTPPKLRIQENKTNFSPNFVRNPSQLAEFQNISEERNETKFADKTSPKKSLHKVNTTLKRNAQGNKVISADNLPSKKRQIQSVAPKILQIQDNATKVPVLETKETIFTNQFKSLEKMSMQNTDFHFNGIPKVSQIQLIALHNLETAEKDIKFRRNVLNKTQSKKKKMAIEKHRQIAAAIRAKKSENKSNASKDKFLYEKEDKQFVPAVSILKVNKQDSRKRFADSTNQKFLSILIEDLLIANIKIKQPLLFQYEDLEFRYVNVFGTIIGVHTTIEKLQIIVEDTTGRVTCILENKKCVNKLSLYGENESKKARYDNPTIKKLDLINIVKKDDAQFIQNLKPNYTSNFIETYTDVMVKKSKSLLIDDYPSRENLGFSENPVGKHVSVTGKPFDLTNERTIYVWDIKFITLDEFMLNLELLVKKRPSKEVNF